MNIQDIRSHFPITDKNRIYLDHAAKSPLPSVVKEATAAYFEERMTGNIIYYPEMMDNRTELQQLLGKLLNANPDRIGFMSSTCEGMNMLVDNLTWAEGDEVIVYAKDFPSNVFPFLKLEKQCGVNIKVVQDHDFHYRIDDYEALITDKTKLLTISAVQFLTGQVADLKRLGELCKERDIIFAVDTIQGAGSVPIDADGWNIDFIANGGHKWMMFPQGTSFLYFSEKLAERFIDSRDGWLDREEPFDLFNWDRPKLKNADRFMYGTGNDLGTVNALAVMRFRAEIGEANIQEMALKNGDHLKKALLDRNLDLLSPLSFRSPIATFRHAESEQIHQALMEQNVTVSLRNGMIRVSPHFYNTAEDIEQFLKILDQVMVSQTV